MRAIPPRGNRCEGSLNLAALQNTAAWLISRKTFKLKNLVFHRKINHADVPPRAFLESAQELHPRWAVSLFAWAN